MSDRNALRFWTPGHERDFQTYMAFDPGVRAWRNAFQTQYGEAPRIDDDSSFNYREAYLAGNGPKAHATDIVPHWSSAGKSADHPTEWKNRFMQQFGIDPDVVAPQHVTPQMQQFMTNELRGHYTNALVRGGR